MWKWKGQKKAWVFYKGIRHGLLIGVESTPGDQKHPTFCRCCDERRIWPSSAILANASWTSHQQVPTWGLETRVTDMSFRIGDQ